MGGSSAGGGRATRALRLLLLLVLALAAVEYLFGSILDASPLRTYLYTPLYNATQPTIRNAERMVSHWPKKLAVIAKLDELMQNRTNSSFHNNSNVNTTKIDITNVTVVNNTFSNITSNITSNMTGLDVTNMTTASLLITKVLEGIKNSVTTEKADRAESTESSLPMCDVNPLDLGPVPADKEDMELKDVEKKYPEVQSGGIYSPPNCTARHKVAIIVPYRDREQHLAIFLNHMHPFLMKQQIEYGIFIVEQEGDKPFNRAKLMNVGFVESQRLHGWECFVFHDIDLLPLDTRNMYSCPKQPRHMSAAIDKFNFKLPYDEIFGGVSALTLEQFLKVNGFSNKYWGWGGEDDDMHSRIAKMNYHVARYKMSIARYAMLNHKKSAVNPKRYQLLSQTKKVFHKDGLSTLVYEVVKVTQHHLYTHVYVNIDERS